MMDLEKGREALRLDLAKRGVASPPESEIAFVLDVSGSFDDEHRSGVTQALLERLVPWAMLFDPDKKMDVFTFADGTFSAHRVGDIVPATCDGYIQREIVGRVPGYGNGTDYHYALQKVLRHFGWEKAGGLLGMFAGKKEKRRTIVLFVTDGVSSDPSETMDVLEASEARKDEVYFLFVGIGGQFPFLKKIADRFSNTGLAVIPDLRKFARFTDEEANALLVGDELVAWLKS